jgi:hypothetical protein
MSTARRIPESPQRILHTGRRRPHRHMNLPYPPTPIPQMKTLSPARIAQVLYPQIFKSGTCFQMLEHILPCPGRETHFLEPARLEGNV